MVAAAVDRLRQDWTVEAVSELSVSAPVGPSLRYYVNAAALLAGPHDPPEALALLLGVEDAFGRKRRGERWRSRVLDLDIVLWSGGAWMSDGLAIPHPLFRARRFVLQPAAQIAPGWVDPLTGFSLRQLAWRQRNAP